MLSSTRYARSKGLNSSRPAMIYSSAAIGRQRASALRAPRSEVCREQMRFRRRRRLPCWEMPWNFWLEWRLRCRQPSTDAFGSELMSCSAQHHRVLHASTCLYPSLHAIPEELRCHSEGQLGKGAFQRLEGQLPTETDAMEDEPGGKRGCHHGRN